MSLNAALKVGKDGVPVSQPGNSNRNLTILVACLATAMLMLDISVINTALTFIGHTIGTMGAKW